MRRSAALMTGVLASLMIGVSLGAQTTSKPKPPAPRPAAPATRKPAPAKPAPAAAAKPAPPVPKPDDFVITTQHMSGDSTTASVLYAKAVRQRIEYGSELTVVNACDSGSVIRIDEKRKRYLVAEARNDDSGDAPGAKPPSGRITYTTTIVDTGERKSMHGNTARHVRITQLKEPDATACDKRQERTETDGWFIDASPGLLCASDRKPVIATTGNCRDTVAYAGAEASTAGYPLAYTLTTSSSDGKSSSMSMTVTSFERQNLQDALFAPPAGYTEVRTLTALTSDSVDAVAKVGVMRLGAKGDDGVSLEVLSEALIVSLADAGIRAVALAATTATEASVEARDRGLDYVLATQITEVRKPRTGLLGRVAGGRDFGARVEYLLSAPGAAKPRLSGTERSGSSALQSAVSTAKSVSRFITPFGLLNSRFNFMGTFANFGGGANPAMAQSGDPMLNTVFSLLDSLPATRMPIESPQSEDAAVAAALEKQVGALTAALLDQP